MAPDFCFTNATQQALFHFQSHFTIPQRLPSLLLVLLRLLLSITTTMGALSYWNGIALLQLIIFPIILVAAIFIWKRTGWRVGSKIWRYAVTLSLIRIAGSISSLLSINHNSHGIEVAVAVCQLIGIAPLLLTFIGLLRQM